MEPTITGINSFDAAVMLEKAILLNGMLVHGTHEQKSFAKKEWATLEPRIRLHINVDATEMAKRELALEHESLDLQTIEYFCI
ncbi:MULTISPECIES: hypothetical protein [unclassified Sporosarcina]|uniref:hypothetical protein n=1 Tax=unclassified Sporosarcina TaxID=2647733 RepID=UPI001A90FAED|nr:MULTISPECIES: hypothetical protein [unclassified Sporosarcina]MBO0587593.1 hypothetical protein [Sporosarcina sp. E16_8]MBO0602419.1 hypothetical protein [Sporosarcina sp. E16_3]